MGSPHAGNQKSGAHADGAAKLMSARDEGLRDGFVEGACWAIGIMRHRTPAEVIDALQKRFGNEVVGQEIKRRNLSTMAMAMVDDDEGSFFD